MLLSHTIGRKLDDTKYPLVEIQNLQSRHMGLFHFFTTDIFRSRVFVCVLGCNYYTGDIPMVQKATPTAEFLARRFMQSVDLPGMTESFNKPVSLILDPGIPHKPREYPDLKIQLLRVMDPQLKSNLRIPCQSVLMINLHPCLAELYLYLKEDGCAVAEVKEYGTPAVAYQQARINFNGTDLGWFKKP